MIYANSSHFPLISSAKSCSISNCSLSFAYLLTVGGGRRFAPTSIFLMAGSASLHVVKPLLLLLVQLLCFWQLEHNTVWGKRCGFQPAILLGFVWFLFFVLFLFSRECNRIAPKIQLGIFSSSFVSSPTISSKVIGTSGNLRGYMVFNSYFTLHFLFCVKFVIIYIFFLILNGFFCCNFNIWNISTWSVQFLCQGCQFFAFWDFERSGYEIHQAP